MVKSRKRTAIISGVSLLGVIGLGWLGYAVNDAHDRYEYLLGVESPLMYDQDFDYPVMSETLKSKLSLASEEEIRENVQSETMVYLESDLSQIDSSLPGWINRYLLGGQSKRDAMFPIIFEKQAQNDAAFNELIPIATIGHICSDIGGTKKFDEYFANGLMADNVPYLQNVSVNDMQEYCVTYAKDMYSTYGNEELKDYKIDAKVAHEYSQALSHYQKLYKQNPKAYSDVIDAKQLHDAELDVEIENQKAEREIAENQ